MSIQVDEETYTGEDVEHEGIEPDEQPDLADQDEDEDDADQDEQPDIDADQAGESKTSGTGSSSGRDRALIRRVATKAAEVATADEQTLAVAVSLLGCGTGLADVTTAIMTAPRSVSAPFGDLLTVAEASGAEQGIIALTLGRPRLRALWSLLNDLGIPGFHSAIPASDAKAALAVVTGANAVGEETRGAIEAVKSLLRKS